MGRILNKYNENELRETINKSRTMAEVIRLLGRSDSSSMRKVIKRYIELYNISLDHFETQKEINARVNSRRKIPIEKILVENSTYNQCSLKRRIIEESLIEYKCKKCNNKGEWNGEKLSLHLDHKNGVNNDNRIENLRFLCPNCHSQTPTYAGKISEEEIERRKKVKKENIKKGHLKQRKVERPSYNQLMMDIKIFGYRGTGERYGVSDNAIRKWKKFYER